MSGSSWFGLRCWLALVGLFCGVLASATVLASDLESAYRAKPSAAVAERLARDWLAKGNAGKAMNWAERMVRSPGATSAQVVWANKLRSDLKWELADAGLGLVILQISPAHAWVEVDDKLLLPHTGNHAVWLAEGAHTLAVDAPDHTSFEQLITAVRNERQVVTVQLASVKKASLKVVSQPVGELWINGKLVQYTDHPQPVALPAGSYLVEVRATNYMPWTKSIVLQPGEERTLKLALQRRDEDVVRRPAASQVEREVTAAERSDRGAVDISRRPAPNRDGPAAAAPSGGGAPSGASDPSSSRARAAERTPDETAEPAVVEVESRESEEDAPSEPWKASSKGLALAVPGLALVGGGLAYAMLGAQAAERVNQEFSPSDPNFDAAYGQAAQQTYIGYGVAGLGLVGVGVGSIWLFGKDGLSRSGKGALLTGAGVVGAGLAGWMWWSAQTLATSAGDFVSADPERDRRLSLASRDSLIAYGAGGVGLAAAAVGIYLMATDGGGSTADAAIPAGRGLARSRVRTQRSVAMPQVLPWTGSGRSASGALLRWSF